jgi:hypothetical protein
VTSAPTHTVPQAGRKPRRLGLYLPWALALTLVIGWCLAWLWLAHETGQRIEAGAASLRASGWQASWSSRRVYGFPFRLDTDFTDLKLADPSGWALALPQAKAEAYLFAPTRWIVAAPAGLTFTRPVGGAVDVTARVLRASVNSWDRHPPSISIEGADLTLVPAPGARPFWLTAAKSLQFDTRAGPDDQGAVFLSLQGGAVSPQSWMGQIARGGPFDIDLDGVVFRAGALAGVDWRDALRNWTHSGGGLDIHQLTLRAGEASLAARRGSLAVADDGTLVGQLDANLDEPERLFRGLSAKPDQTQTLRLTFHDGAAWLGKVRIAPAPDLF